MLSRYARGFTLIEIMVAVVIVGILASIAYPSYLKVVQSSHRSDAQARLVDISQKVERCFTEKNVYNHTDCTSSVQNTERYNISISATATGYTLTAVPQAKGGQNTDHCGTMTVNHLGIQSPADCWD